MKNMSKWYEEAEFYHVYPIGLLGAPRRNERGETVHRFSVLTEKWLPHIRDLGFRAIYIGPLFESTAHGYDTIDYKQVDRRLGDNQDFKCFVQKAHEMGIKIVVDGVFNHTGRDFFAFRDIREKKWDSSYKNWYKGINFDGNTAYNDGFSYESWHGCGDLAVLNLYDQAVREYLFGVVDFWINEFGIDGIRLDCADCLEFGFMEELRRRTEAKKADFWLMGEVIHGDYSRWAGPDQSKLHSVTNYELWKGLYSGHNSHNYFEIAHTIRREFGNEWGIYRGMKLYTFADNHDVNRIASLLDDKRHLKPVYAMVYMLPGIPSVYYGSEFGIEGRKENGGDDALRPALDLDEMEKNAPQPWLCGWLQVLSKIRREHPACVNGSYQELLLTNRQYAFGRFQDKDAVIVAANNDGEPADLWIPAADTDWEDAETGARVRSEGGKLHVNLPAGGAAVYTAVS